MSCGVGRRHGSDPVLLWLWHRLAATTPIEPQDREPPYAVEANKEKKKKKKRQSMTKEARIYSGEKIAPSISGAEKTGQPHGKE